MDGDIDTEDFLEFKQRDTVIALDRGTPISSKKDFATEEQEKSESAELRIEVANSGGETPTDSSQAEPTISSDDKLKYEETPVPQVEEIFEFENSHEDVKIEI